MALRSSELDEQCTDSSSSGESGRAANSSCQAGFPISQAVLAP